MSVVGLSAATPGGSTTGTAPLVAGVTYGPDGSEWPGRTPPWDAAASVTVSSLASLKTEIGNATSGKVIYVDSSFTGTGIDLTGTTAPGGLTTNVLVRPATWGQSSGSLVLTGTRSVTLAGFEVSGSMKIQDGSDFAAFARCHARGGTFLSNRGSASNQWVGVVADERGTSTSDRFDAYATSGGAPTTDLTVTRCWIDGKVLAAGSSLHLDTFQSDALAGVWRFTNTFFGAPQVQDSAGGVNGTTQMRNEHQGGVPYGEVWFTDCFFAGSVPRPGDGAIGQANSTLQWTWPWTGAPPGYDHRIRCQFHQSGGGHGLLVNQSPLELTDCVIGGGGLKVLASTSGQAPAYPHPERAGWTYTESQPVMPTFVKPPWAWW